MDPSSFEWFTWLLLAVAVALATRLWWKNRGLPPGPIGLPFFGYYPFLTLETPVQFANFAKRYGDIFSFRTMGGSLIVGVNGPKAIKEVFVDRAEEFYGRSPQLNTLNFFDGGLGVAQSEGIDWKEKRRFFLSTAKNFGFGKTEFESYAHELISEMIHNIRQHGNEPFDIRDEVTYVTGNAISKIMCDIKFSKNDRKFRDLIEGFNELISNALVKVYLEGLFFWLFLTFTPKGRASIRAVKKLNSITDEIVDNHIQTFDASHQRDFIDAYLNQMNTLAQKGQLQSSSFSMDALKATTLNMLLEGTESTGSTVALLLLNLAEHPDSQKRAQKEIDEVVGQSRLPSWTDRQKMPFVEALILELYRTATFFNTSPFYSNFEEAFVRGYRIPKRSLLVMSYRSINNDPNTFPNPSAFDPSRFLGPDGKRIKHENPVPFGVGKRSCIGESLAQMEVYLIITSLLQHFTLYPGHGEMRITAKPRH